jgi:2,5-furandicarboxylate decarboxylase 1
MPYRDFRRFLEVLRQHGELVDIDRPVALSDIGKAMKQSYRRQGPGLMFNNNGSAFPLVAGVLRDPQQGAAGVRGGRENDPAKGAVGAGASDRARDFSRRGALQEVLIEGDAIDIARFPVPTYSPKDGGPYISAPSSGRTNGCSIQPTATRRSRSCRNTPSAKRR